MVLTRLRLIARRARVRFHEWRLGIHSEGDVSLSQYGISDPECYYYTPTNYQRFAEVMERITVRPDRDVFLDLGSGKGRVVILAAKYPFKKVIGVEIAPELNAIADENVRRVRHRLRCQEIELHIADAKSYVIPPEVTVVYLWNPFREALLAAVFANLRTSIQQTPREVTVAYLSPDEITHLDRIKETLGWLEERQRIRLRTEWLVLYRCGPTGGGSDLPQVSSALGKESS